jgi:hypothetical protein
MGQDKILRVAIDRYISDRSIATQILRTMLVDLTARSIQASCNTGPTGRDETFRRFWAE